MDVVTLNGEIRTALGKSKAKALRREGKILCELYGGEENVHFTVTLNDVRKLIYTSKFNLVDIVLDGKSYRSIIKEIQFHPVSEQVLHIDFQQLVAGRKVKVEVPILTTGTSPGVKEGGKLFRKVRYLKIKTAPEHLVDSLTIDISDLELGQSVRVRDIVVQDEIEVLTSPGIPVATVEVPRLLKLEEEVVTEGEEGEEGVEGAEGGDAAAPADGDGGGDGGE